MATEDLGVPPLPEIADSSGTQGLVPSQKASTPLVVSQQKPYRNESPESARLSNLALALTDSEMSAEDISKVIKTVAHSNVMVARTNNEIAKEKTNERNKQIMLGISSVLIVVPLFPGLEALTALSIASIGAVGFGTALFSFYGQNAFEAGMKFRSFFQRRDKEGSVDE